MKIRTVIILAAVVVVAMIVEGNFVAYVSARSAMHNYNGICNVGVGRPYQDFIHQLRVISESGDTNRLTTVLRIADEHSRDIYNVWLYGDREAYEKSLTEIFK